MFFPHYCSDEGHVSINLDHKRSVKEESQNWPTLQPEALPFRHQYKSRIHLSWGERLLASERSPPTYTLCEAVPLVSHPRPPLWSAHHHLVRQATIIRLAPKTQPTFDFCLSEASPPVTGCQIFFSPQFNFSLDKIHFIISLVICLTRHLHVAISFRGQLEKQLTEEDGQAGWETYRYVSLGPECWRPRLV